MYRNLQGKCYDLEYAINAVKEMQNSHEHFQNITQLIYQAITTKQRLNAEESKKTDKKKPVCIKEFLAHLIANIFLPAVATGLSSSASVSADLKSSPAQAIKSSSTSSLPDDLELPLYLLFLREHLFQDSIQPLARFKENSQLDFGHVCVGSFFILKVLLICFLYIYV
ncbi:uncharacterized protein TNCT_547251 [Trichonephila clavata]|uniref:Uncharacterized protein n=1 Tax=Trichonephila clavata TaxID=2740835 RepID=A0A8X6KRB1_TRICU|nr:uncharacterized protein TNCT_547251 [Trichonephila clavata]